MQSINQNLQNDQSQQLPFFSRYEKIWSMWALGVTICAFIGQVIVKGHP